MLANVKTTKMSLTSMNSGQTLKAQFNPTELEENLAANWNELALLGMSHMPQQYQQTGNLAFSFELAFRAYVGGQNLVQQNLAARRFLHSLFYSSRASAGQGVAGGSPSRILFVWPQLVSLTCVARTLKIKHTQFQPGGAPIHFSAAIEIKEIRDVRLYAEDVLQMGTQRSGEQNQLTT